MKLSLTLPAALALLPSLAYAGLEDAKYSTVLTPQNFDNVIASQSEGTLVAFFAPWCGHCKNLEPVWSKIAEAFDGDDRCKVAHLNADESAAKPLASKYGVSGFPTIKFIAPPSKGGKVETYQSARSEEAFLEYLNKQCGTNKGPGGVLSDLAGRIPSLDTLASVYLTPSATRPALLSSASALASSLTDSSSSLATYYLKLMTKWAGASGAQLEDARAWIAKESERLGKLAGRKGKVAVKQLEEARMKQNVLAAFASAASAASSASTAASSAVSSAATAAETLASSASFAAGQATESAKTLAGDATASAKSAAGEASKTLESVVEKATGRVKEEL
ncbi:hypothetical protein JCM1841_000014 [Sporobolomyces salmonicolor]